jgi:hypothetical protein
MDLSGIFQEMQTKLFMEGDPVFRQWIGHADLRPPQLCVKLSINKLEKGCELFGGLPDGEMYDASQFTFVVTFAEPQIVERQAVYETLRDLSNSLTPLSNASGPS